MLSHEYDNGDILEIKHITEFGDTVNEFDRIEFQLFDECAYATIEKNTSKEEGTYYQSAIDWWVGPGDLWEHSYLGCTPTLLEAWRRIYDAAMHN